MSRQASHKDTLLAVGLMSGTSADGIDAALVTVSRNPRRLRLLHYMETPHQEPLRRRILDAAAGRAHTGELCRLHSALGAAFGEAVVALCKAAEVAPEELDIIGSHGQTVWHAPDANPPATLQLGNGAVIARRTGCPVVADFRAADLAVGGQGAPLAPITHHLMFTSPEKNRAVLNLGGIANVTWLPAGGAAEDVLAFDTGPGNMVVDGLAARFSGDAEKMDRDGARAARGTVNGPLLDELLAHPYLALPLPKSTGREMFGEGFVQKLIERGLERELSPDDLIATATCFTARTVADAIRGLERERHPDELLLCGGGVHNPVLLALLEGELPGVGMIPVDTLGVPADALEAMVFADLACRAVWGETGNLPAVTGARQEVLLGAVNPV
ncbi:MAG: anhydro-N-acetylmuramic acid kinase [Leptospirillia bacterium]